KAQQIASVHWVASRIASVRRRAKSSPSTVLPSGLALDLQALLGALAQGGQLAREAVGVDERVRRAGGSALQALLGLGQAVGERMRRQVRVDAGVGRRHQLLDAADAGDIGLDLARILDGIEPQAADREGAIALVAVLD